MTLKEALALVNSDAFSDPVETSDRLVTEAESVLANSDWNKDENRNAWHRAYDEMTFRQA